MNIKFLGELLTSYGLIRNISSQEQVMKASRTGCFNHMVWYKKHVKQDAKVTIRIQVGSIQIITK